MANMYSSGYKSEDSTDPSSLCSETGNCIEQQQYVRKNKLSSEKLMLLCLVASVSSGIVITRPDINISHSSVYQYNVYDFGNRGNIDVLYDFISSLINNSEDLDGRIVDMVNEKFWNLI
jgi:hypothetical protein